MKLLVFCAGLETMSLGENSQQVHRQLDCQCGLVAAIRHELVCEVVLIKRLHQACH